jgi:hypothetical protein
MKNIYQKHKYGDNGLNVSDWSYCYLRVFFNILFFLKIKVFNFLNKLASLILYVWIFYFFAKTND